MEHRHDPGTLIIRAKIREFGIPPIEDALVLGRNAPIGAEAMCRAMKLLHVAEFELITLDHEAVEAILVRATLLNKIPKDKLIAFIEARVLPFMSVDEVIHLDIEPEMYVEEQL